MSDTPEKSSLRLRRRRLVRCGTRVTVLALLE